MAHLHRAVLLATLGIWGCSGTEADAPPQSVAVDVPGEGAAPTQGPGQPVEDPLSALAAALPSFAALDAEHQRRVLTVLDQQPAPCEPCQGGSIAACLVMPEACAVLPELGERAVKLVAAEYSREQVLDAVAYPDLWFAEARGEGTAPETIEVLVWLDPTSSFVGMVQEHGKRLDAPDVELTTILWAPKGPGRRATVTCQEAGVGIEECLAATALALEGRAPGNPALGGLVEAVKAVDDEPTLPELASLDERAEALGIRATPTWFVSGHRLRGAQSFGAISRLVQLERLDVGKLQPSTAPERGQEETAP